MVKSFIIKIFIAKMFIVLTDLMTEKIDQVNHHFVVKYPLPF